MVKFLSGSQCWFVILFVLASLSGCSQTVEQVYLRGSTMGTTYNIKYLPQKGAPSSVDIQQHIDKLLEQVNDEMSTYRPHSELSQFNLNKSIEPIKISEQLSTVLSEAIRLNKLTDGALDVTAGPVVNLWGFGPEARPETVPSAQEIAERKKITGIEKLHLSKGYLKKDMADVYVDLSSIAKGWGVDVVANYLESLHLNDYLVEIGGEMRLKGVNQESIPWRIAIEKPTTEERSVQEIIEPKNMAVATSGDYRNFFEKQGVRYSHIIDPKTGKPIQNRVVSVTIIDKSCMTADGLATAFMVLGREKALAIAEKEHIATLIITKEPDGFKEYSSTAFRALQGK